MMRRTPGFTLVEVLVALALSSLVALTAHAMLAGVLDGSDALRRAAPSQERGILARAWLLEACRTLEAGTGVGAGFEATATEARFLARLPAPDGSVDRRQVSLRTVGGGLTLSMGDLTVRPLDRVDGVTLDYMIGVRGEGEWVTGWHSPVSAPLAIRVRWSERGVSDSLLCLIGGRG
jgi:prepilin-type N-terminal cleavage/methylation domain-containing protein